ncbi:MAG: phosphoadenosine phosphosulfate reductase [Bacteroidetes bacterium]|nr:MAG: phosphoadenosine phosphosulfate reductase [Bacteroidota bacterium]
MKELVDILNEELKNASPQEVLGLVYERFKDKIAFASSLGYEDQVLTQMIATSCPEMKIFTLDTGRLFPETYDLIEKTVARYKPNFQIYFPDYQAVETMTNSKGVNLFYDSIDNRKLCCSVRKTMPLKRALSGLEAWITGLRRSQSITRTHLQVVEWDEANQLIKINPLINWNEDDVIIYINNHNIPYNLLHDKGFPSIGCQPCTRSIEVGEDVRAGRWWWELPEQKECGLHKAK